MAQRTAEARDRRKTIGETYFERLDRGDDILGLFAEDAQVYFPKGA